MKRLLPILAFFGLIALGACQPEPFLSVSPDSLSFNESGGSQTVQISANYPWTASVSGSGFSVSPSSGEGNATVTVTASAASSPDGTSGTLNVRSEGLSASVSLSQAAKPTLVLGDGVKVPASGGTVEIPVQYNVDYTVEVESSARSWIKFIKTKSLSSGKLEFEISENEGDERSGKVTLKDNGGKASPVTVTITQEGEKKVLVVGGAAVVPAEGATVEVDVQYNVDYTVEIESSAQSWIHYIETKTVQSGKLVFKVEANDGEERSGKVTVKDNSGKVDPVTITVVQEAEPKVLVVGDAATVPAEGATVEVDVQYNVDYTVEVESSARSWIHYVETKAVQSGKLVFKVDANDGAERSGKVTVKDNSGKVDPVTLTFRQERRVIPVESVELDRTEMELGLGETYTLTATINPSDATDFSLTWESEDTDIATVDDNGIVAAVEEGTTIITAKAGEKAATCTVKVINREDERAKAILMEFYEAMDGPNWNDNYGWGTDVPLRKWSHINYKNGVGVTGIFFMYDNSIKGTIPASIGDLTTLTQFSIWDAPDVTGTLPDSFRNLVNLETFEIILTSMTSIPDVFGGMKNLKRVQINSNDKMNCPLPASICNASEPEFVHFISNRFTGNIPESWAKFGTNLSVGDNCLSGVVPETLLAIGDDAWLIDEILYQKEGYGFDLRNVELHGAKFWPDGQIEDLDGNLFSFEDVVSKNKYTVFLFWATWCPFSKVLMPQLKDYYEHYHDSGLEIIATIAAGDSDGNTPDIDVQRMEVNEKGYDKWYNYYFFQSEQPSYPMYVPIAEVYDSEGNILFSGFCNLRDPGRNRFGRTASSELIPFLESLLGPADYTDVYTSTDFSKDGEVLTLQKATVGNGINIVFMGDAYTDKDMEPGGLYETVMTESMEEFFAIEPYKTFRDRFNVYAVKVVSTNDRIGNGYSTALSCSFGSGTTVLGDDNACYSYAQKVPGITNQDNLLICVMVNSLISKGTTSMSYMRQSGVAYTTTIGNMRELYGDVLRHEAGGHGFAFLSDEYTNHFDYAPADHIENYNSMYKQYGWFSNVDFTDDPAKIRWSAFLSDERYKDEVGIFEGGALYMKGVWRPSRNSVMNENMGDFNAPSRWAIYKRIMELSGEGASFEKFLEYDAVNRGRAQASTARPPLKAAANRTVEYPAPPVIVP